MDGLRRWIDRVLSGGAAPSDPLYLSNRTLAQKLKLPLLIGVPALIVAGFIFMALSSRYFAREPAPPPKALSAAEIAAKMLPDLNNLHVSATRDVEIVDLRVDSGARRLAGTVRNNTAHSIQTTNVVFELADADGSRVGAASTQIADLAPNSSLKFTVPIEASNAAAVIVREVRWR